MRVIMFKPEFVEAIRTGRKVCTTRPLSKRPLKEGQIVSLRQWSGLPYRSKQQVIGTATIERVDDVMITDLGEIRVWRHWLDAAARIELAQREGFQTPAEYRDWIFQAHRIEGTFLGVLYRWRLH